MKRDLWVQVIIVDRKQRNQWNRSRRFRFMDKGLKDLTMYRSTGLDGNFIPWNFLSRVKRDERAKHIRMIEWLPILTLPIAIAVILVVTEEGQLPHTVDGKYLL